MAQKNTPIGILSVAAGWAPIDSAPKNGDEILGFREDCGIMLIRWIAPCDFLTDREIESMELTESETEDWFVADFVSGGRLDGDLAPTHWHPLPALPNVAVRDAEDGAKHAP